MEYIVSVVVTHGRGVKRQDGDLGSAAGRSGVRGSDVAIPIHSSKSVPICRSDSGIAHKCSGVSDIRVTALAREPPASPWSLPRTSPWSPRPRRRDPQHLRDDAQWHQCPGNGRPVHLHVTPTGGGSVIGPITVPATQVEPSSHPPTKREEPRSGRWLTWMPILHQCLHWSLVRLPELRARPQCGHRRLRITPDGASRTIGRPLK
jgi:hypothetical protein